MPETLQRPRGRPAAATRPDVLAAATRRYRAGERIDVQALAAELGLGRATLYRWFGDRDGLIGAVLVSEFELVVRRAQARAGGAGASGLLAIFDRINHTLATAPPLRSFLELERDGLRILTSSAGPVQPAAVAAIAALIASDRAYAPPVDPETLAYAIVRLCEAFIYNDAAAGIRGDVVRLHAVQAALLGV